MAVKRSAPRFEALGLEKDALKPLKEELTAYVTLLIDPPTPAKEKKKPGRSPGTRAPPAEEASRRCARGRRFRGIGTWMMMRPVAELKSD